MPFRLKRLKAGEWVGSIKDPMKMEGQMILAGLWIPERFRFPDSKHEAIGAGRMFL